MRLHRVMRISLKFTEDITHSARTVAKSENLVRYIREIAASEKRNDGKLAGLSIDDISLCQVSGGENRANSGELL